MIAAPSAHAGAVVLSRELHLDVGHGALIAAAWHVSAQGIVEPAVDGVAVSDELFTPGWTSYQWRLRYRSFDVTRLMRGGADLQLALGNGWWRGRLTFLGARGLYGDVLGAIGQLELTYEDGHRQYIVTDRTWRAYRSDVLEDDLYDGQVIDARLRSAERVDGAAVEELAFDPAVLVPYISPPVRRQETLRPQRIWQSPSGRTLVDFGQNIVGFLRLEVQGDAGDEVVVRHAEVLEAGELCTKPLRSALATDRFILSGGVDRFEPTMTFHGFRYAEVTGWPGQVDAESLEAVVVHTDLRRTGTFVCSDERLNRLHENVVWSFKGNALGLPTDCPQRDERLGWTGDLAVFAPAAAFLFDVEDFLRDWLRDLAAEQAASGTVPYVVPDALALAAELVAPGMLDPDAPVPLNAVTALWGDAAVWVPWALWQAYGDVDVLAECFDSMQMHVRQAAQQRSRTGVWDEGFQFADWLDPTAPPDQPYAAKADKGVVATACLFRSATILADAAARLGRPEAAGLAALAGEVRAAFNTEYVGADGRVRSDCETVYALAITFGLLDEGDERRAGDRLRERVALAGHTVSTGFAGTPFVLDALARTGHLEDAYALLLQRRTPSWLYQVEMGATTTWERWDSLLPDGTVNPGEMTSFNHYAFGAVADWMHRTIGGLSPLEPGWRSVRIAPRPGGGLTWARTGLQTRHGEIRCEWRQDGVGLDVEFELPRKSRGVLALPGQPTRDFGPGRHAVHVPATPDRA